MCCLLELIGYYNTDLHFAMHFFIAPVAGIEESKSNAYQVSPRDSSRQAARRTRSIVSYFVSFCRGESVRDRTYTVGALVPAN